MCKNLRGKNAPAKSDNLVGAQFAALIYSIFTTLQFNDIDIPLWLTHWLEACAVNRGKPPVTSQRGCHGRWIRNGDAA